MKESLLVSIIIISYKHKQYITDCFNSILAQTYNNMEILYLDDASNDGTFEKAGEYAQRFTDKFRRVIFIQNKDNQGLVKSLNKLVNLCEGKYVKFLAADDFLLPDSIEKLEIFMNEHTHFDMAYSNGVVGNSDTHFPIEKLDSFKYIYQKSQTSGSMIFDDLYSRDFISAPTVMIRKEAYKKFGLYDEQIGVEDWEFFLRIAAKGNIGYLNEITVMYRILEDSLSHSSRPERRMNMKKSELMILEKYKHMAKQSEEKIETSLNEALSDAFHIGNNEYIVYLYDYAQNNNVKISTRNLYKHQLYKIKVIKLLDSLS